MVEKIWADSGDSHVMEPDDLWLKRMPRALADRAPLTERADGKETVHVDGKVLRRDPVAFQDAMRPPGAYDLTARMQDLDDQGIWGEVVFPSRGFWISSMTDAELARESARAWNDWAAETVIAHSPRLLPAAVTSVLDVADCVRELQRTKGMGFQVIYLPTTPPVPYNSDQWEPLWEAAEEAELVLAFHVGTGADPVVARGPGGAVINYVETFFPGQRVVAHLVGSGALDRHPGLRIFIAEGGAAWVPPLADRMEEGYRQHSMFVRPKLGRTPREIIFSQVYTSFQHDITALVAVQHMGYDNVMWGSDYPHLEGTFPRSQELLHELFDNGDPAAVERVIHGTFNELFVVPARV